MLRTATDILLRTGPALWVGTIVAISVIEPLALVAGRARHAAAGYG